MGLMTRLDGTGGLSDGLQEDTLRAKEDAEWKMAVRFGWILPLVGSRFSLHS